MAGNSVQFTLYQNMAERARLSIKLATATRMEKEMAALDAKYDGKQEASVQSDIEKLADTAMGVSDYLNRVQYGLKQIDNVRDQLIDMRTSVDSAAYEAFDLYFGTLNQYTGVKYHQPDSLIANPYDGRGSWTNLTDQVYAGSGNAISVERRYLGNDYAIQLDDGTLFSANQKTLAMERDDDTTLEFSKLSVTSLDTATGAITFHYDDGGAGVDYSGTLKRGGGTVLNAWLYNNFATQADKDRAAEDISAAHQLVSSSERGFLIDEAGLDSARSVLKTKSDELNTLYQKVSEENLTAKQAERRAIKARFELQNNSLTLAQGRASVLIQQMFVQDWGIKKQSITDVMFSAAGYKAPGSQ